jgi:heat shock protein HslJ
MQTKNRKLISLILSAMLLTLTACAPADIPVTGGDPTALPAGDSVLENTKWTLISHGPAETQIQVVEGTTVTLEFDDRGNVAGDSGCNLFGGDYSVTNDDEITITNVVSTERACLDEDAMEQERQYYNALNAVTSFELSENMLSIWYSRLDKPKLPDRVSG